MDGQGKRWREVENEREGARITDRMEVGVTRRLFRVWGVLTGSRNKSTMRAEGRDGKEKRIRGGMVDTGRSSSGRVFIIQFRERGSDEVRR
jgi:hypothetical protein